MHRFDASLVTRARAGDDRALEDLAAEVVPIVLGWCTRLGGPRVDPEDAAHDALVIMVSRLPSLRDSSRFGAWLFQITRKTLAGHRRRGWMRNWMSGVAPVLFDWETPAALAMRSELGKKLQAAIETLPAEQREVIVLCDVDEMTDAEAAAVLEVPPGTVKSRLRLGRKRLHEELYRMNIAPDYTAAPEGVP